MKLYTPLEDIELSVENRTEKFYKDKPYTYSTFIKVYNEHFKEYIESDNDKLIELNFDFGNETYSYDYINTYLDKLVQKED